VIASRNSELLYYSIPVTTSEFCLPANFSVVHIRDGSHIFDHIHTHRYSCLSTLQPNWLDSGVQYTLKYSEYKTNTINKLYNLHDILKPNIKILLGIGKTMCMYTKTHQL